MHLPPATHLLQSRRHQNHGQYDDQDSLQGIGVSGGYESAGHDIAGKQNGQEHNRRLGWNFTPRRSSDRGTRPPQQHRNRLDEIKNRHQRIDHLQRTPVANTKEITSGDHA